MHLVYLILLLAAVIAMNWRFLGLHKAFGGGAGGRPRLGFGKPCRWKRDPTRKGQDLERYVCSVCGVDAYTAEGRPPRQCKRNLRESAL